MNMSFYSWCFRNRNRFRNTGIADLISDMRNDHKNFPRSASYEKNEQYLFMQGACDACMDCFHEAWKMYWKETRGKDWISC